MELQELVVRAATMQFRFRLAPRFADVRGALIEELREANDLSEYGWGEAHVQLHNAERTRQLIVGSRELRIVYEHIERIDDFLDTARAFFERGLEALGVRELEFLGVRTYWLAAVDSFDELRDWMVERLSPSEPFSAALGDVMTDVGWILEYRRQDPQHIIRIGPMTVDQLIEQVLGTSERELFPDAFLFLDLDRMYKETPIAADNAVERAFDAFQRSLAIGEKIAATLISSDKPAPAG